METDNKKDMLSKAARSLFSTTKAPLRVAVTGAAGQIGYSLLPSICSGEMLGKDQPVSIVLVDIPQTKKVLEGVSMEITDCAYPLVREVAIPDNFTAAFKDVDIAMLVGASPRGPGMERSDLLKKNAEIFIEQGKVIDQVASKDCRVLVVGNPANTNAVIGSHFAKRISKDNWTAMSRLDHDRGLGQLRAKTGCSLGDIQHFCVWGNHSPTMFPDIRQCTILGKPAIDLVGKEWYNNYFVGCVQKRGAEVINARGKSSAASAANAAFSHVRSWHLGSTEWVSMSVQSRGEYGIPEGLVFSFPVTISGGKWQIVKGLELDSYQKEMIKKTTDELVTERNAIQSMLT